MISAAILLTGILLSGDPTGTEATDTLSTAVVTAERGITISREDTLALRNSTATATDLLLMSPGLVVSDNGGFAGLKTVSLRGLGSPHTTIRIDGIKVGNVQSGQNDLGMLPIENFGAAIIDYAQNSLNFCTQKPQFGDRNIAGRINFQGGSFGTYIPNGRLSFRINDKVSLSANAAGIISKGDFPYGETEDGATLLRRGNNDIKQYKAGIDAFGTMDGGDWTAKAYYSDAERGTPGSTDWPAPEDRQNDRNTFLQGMMRKSISPLYSLAIAGKASYDDVLYHSAWGDSDYTQTELQLSSTHRFRVSEWLELSAVTEWQWDDLSATSYDATRSDVTGIAGAALRFKRFNADITLQYEGIFDKGGASHNIISPAADLRYSLTKELDITGFARRAYRAPTFNELYYPGYGNPELKPEDALLTDIGIDWRKAIHSGWTAKAKIDAFYNYLTDKITSAPSPEDPNLWFPYNIGEVRASGFDAEAGTDFTSGEWKTGADVRYSFQNAVNVPYLAKHTVVLTADAAFKGWMLDAIWNYRGGRRHSYGEMPDWNTLDIIFSKSVSLRNREEMTFRLICRNIADFRYEFVTGYPMQGRSITAGLGLNF